MTHIKKQLRPGVTAIAAALVLSTMPAFAQTGGSQPVVTLPTPAPPVAAPAPTLPTPAAPVARVVVPEVAPPASAETRAAPAERTRTANAVRRTQPVTRSAAPAVAQAEVPAAAPVIPSPEPMLTEAPVVTPAPMPTEAAPAPAEPAVADDGSDILPIVGGAAGLLLLAGGAYALSRRRRETDETDYAAESWEQDHIAYAEPATPAEPAWREPAPVPAMAATAIPAEMDLSRYGRHTQAAYAGPTPDNPSLSLKRRLKRAAFFDQRERMAREASEPSDMAQPVSTPDAAPQREQLVTSRRISPRAGTEALFGFRPTYQN